MANEIVTALPDNIAKDLTVDKQGRIFVSRRGTARLSGVRLNSIQAILSKIEGDQRKPLQTAGSFAPKGTRGDQQTLPKIFQPFAGQNFEGDNLPDVLVSAIIKYFAYQGRETAQQTDMVLGAIGLRAIGQKILGFESVQKRTLTNAEIIELCCLPVPSNWQRRFPEEYYEHLSRLTGLKAFGNSRPTLWAAKTKELVYDYLPPILYQEIKRCKTETGSYDKLHQFLADDGLRIFEQHQRTLLTLMQASATLTQLKTLLDQSCTETYQLVLLAG
jgi:hypothetical protein